MFRSELPILSSEETSKMTIDRISAQRVTDGPKPRRAAILLVEDDPSVRSLVTRLLTLKNYRVFVAESGPAALPLWEQHRNEIDLLLTDMMMPQGMNGRDLAAHCLAQNSRLKIIFTSGYNMELPTIDGCLREGVNFLQKPYRPEQLMQLIETVLATSPNVKNETYAPNPAR
jgi:CheY-like chemotaxis protein